MSFVFKAQEQQTFFRNDISGKWDQRLAFAGHPLSDESHGVTPGVAGGWQWKVLNK